MSHTSPSSTGRSSRCAVSTQGISKRIPSPPNIKKASRKGRFHVVPPYFTQLCCASTTLTPCFTNTPTSLSEYLLQDYLPAASALSSTSRKLSLPENLWYSFFSNAFYFSIINKKSSGFQPLFSFVAAEAFNTAHRHLLLIIDQGAVSFL